MLKVRDKMLKEGRKEPVQKGIPYCELFPTNFRPKDWLILRRALFVLIIMLTFLFVEATAEEIRFSPWPIGPRDQSIYDYKPLIDYLSKQLNQPFKIVYFDKYERVMEEFKNGNLDIITIGPNPFMKLRQDYPYASGLVLTKDESGRALYTCSVVTRKNGPNSIRAIKGTLALCQGLCTCGRFYASYVLRLSGKDIGKFNSKEYLFHNDVVEAVIRGEAEAGFLRTDVAKKYSGYNIKIIHTGPLLPNRLVVANKKTLKDETIEKIKRILLDINPSTHPFLGPYKHGFEEFKEEQLKVLDRMK